MGKTWFFTRDGQQLGPVEWVELQTLAAARKLTPTDRVWTDGFADWVEASTVPDLFAPAAAPSIAPTVPPALAHAPLFASTPPAAQQSPSVDPLAPVASKVPAKFPASGLIDYAAISGAPQFAFAGFFNRFLAAFIDGVIIIAMCVGVAFAFMWFVGEDAARANAQTMGIFLRVSFVVVAWIYCATLESGPRRSTLGKRLLGMQVTDMAGNQISFLRATVRHFGKILSEIILMFGYLMMKFTPNNQCLHDMIAGCVVVKREWN